MKLLMISTYPPAKCGIGDYTQELVTNFSKKVDEIHILTYKNSNAERIEKERNTVIHRVLKGHILIGWQCAKEIKKIKPDIIHVQSQKFLYPALLYLFALLIRRRPIVVTAHDTLTTYKIYRTFHILPFLWLLYKKSRVIITLSDDVRKSLIKLHRIDSKKIIKMDLGVDTATYAPGISSERFKEMYKLENEFIIMFFGFINYGKNIEDILYACNKNLSKMQNSKILIVGDSPEIGQSPLKGKLTYLDRLKKLVKELHLENYVIFTGYLDDDLVPSCLASADIIVFPYYTHNSASLVKAMASGCAVIAYNLGGFSEIIKDGENGLLVEPNPDSLAEAILRLYSDKKLINKLKRNARVTALKISWNTVAKKSLEIYERILQNNYIR